MQSREIVLKATDKLIQMIKTSVSNAPDVGAGEFLKLRDEAVSKILSAFDDIAGDGPHVRNTEQWWAENAERSDSILLAAIETLSEGVALYDPDDRLVLCNSHMVNYNPASAHLMLPGVKFEEILRANVAADEINGALTNSEDFVAERLAQHQNPKGPILQRRKDGSWLEITEERTADGFTFVRNIDITERVVAEEALQQSEERFRQFAEASSDWFWEMDETLAFTFLSEGLKRVTGEATQDVVGKTRWQTAKSSEGPKWIAHRADLEAHRPFKDFEFENKNGVVCSVSGLPVFDKSGVFRGYRGVTRDVTGAKLTDEKLHQAQRLDMIGQLTGGVAHDFNNLLAVVLGNLELLAERDLPAGADLLVERAISASLRGADLTRNMLSFARRAQLDPQRLNINDAVRNAESWIGRTLPATVSIEMSLLSDLWPVQADPSSLESAILNLILNARDAMDGQGKLTIETTNLHVDKTYFQAKQEDLVPGQYVMLAISDTGHGIAKSDLHRIFEPFHTSKETGKGSGLGLSMVQGFMKQSEGMVQVYSEVEVGTTFKLFFPAADADLDGSDVAQRDVEPEQTGELRILLAEDEADVRDTLIDILESAGHHITAAASGDAAYEIYNADPSFDLLLTDIVMPGTLQGTDLARKLRRKWPDLPVAFMSGYANEATVHGNGLRPEDIRLMKPVRRADLLAALTKSRVKNTPPS